MHGLTNPKFESCRVYQNTSFMLNYIPPPKKNPALYEIMWKTEVERDRLQLAVQYGASELQAG